MILLIASHILAATAASSCPVQDTPAEGLPNPAPPVATQPNVDFDLPGYLQLKPGTSTLLGFTQAEWLITGDHMSWNPSDQDLHACAQFLINTYGPKGSAALMFSLSEKQLRKHPSLQLDGFHIPNQRSECHPIITPDGIYMESKIIFEGNSDGSPHTIWWQPDGPTYVHMERTPRRTEAEGRIISVFGPSPSKPFLRSSAFGCNKAIQRAALLLNLGITEGYPKVTSNPLEFEFDFSKIDETASREKTVYERLSNPHVIPLNGLYMIPLLVHCKFTFGEDGTWSWQEEWVDSAKRSIQVLVQVDGDAHGPRHVVERQFIVGTSFEYNVMDARIDLISTKPIWIPFTQRESDRLYER